MSNSDQFAADPVRWEEPPANLALESNQVHLWRAWLDQPTECVQSLARTLGADERSRSERFHLARDRERFIVRRGLLRTILGRYCGIEPNEVRFCYGPYGKPALALHDMPNCLGASLYFNSTHSQELALYALAFEREIGVDVEKVRPITEQAIIMQLFFSDYEAAVLDSLPSSQKDERFLNCWTFKEAYLKARGQGLDESLAKEMALLVSPDSARPLDRAGRTGETARWSARTLTPAAGYTATVVVEGRECKCQFWDVALAIQPTSLAPSASRYSNG